MFRPVKPDDGHCRPKHVVSVLLYIHTYTINKLCYWLKIPFTSYTHTTGMIHLKTMDGSVHSVMRSRRLSRLSLGVNGKTMIELVMTECLTADPWTGRLPKSYQKRQSLSHLILYTRITSLITMVTLLLSQRFLGARDNFQRLIKISLLFADVHNAKEDLNV